MNVFSTLAPPVRRNLLVLMAAGICFWSGLAALLPVMPLYVQSIGGSSREVGWVMGAFAIGLLVSRAWLSRLADERGRKMVLLIGMGAIALAPMIFANSQSIPVLILSRAFHGISIAAFATAYVALVVDLSPPKQRGELIGYMSLVNPLGLAMGPALGGYLQDWVGYGITFWIAACIGCLGLVCVTRIQEPRPLSAQNTAAQDASGVPGNTRPFWRLLVTPRVRIPAVVLLMVGLAFGSLTTFAPLFIKSVGVSLNVGLFYTTAAIASFCTRLVVGQASDRYGRGRFITLSLVFYGSAMTLLWAAQNTAMFLCAALLQGVGSATLIPMIAALMADRSYPNERGRMFGLCMVGFDVGIAIAGPSLGAIADTIGYRGAFGLTSGLVFLGLLIFVTFSSKDLAHSLRFSLASGRDVYAIPPAE